MNERIRQFLLTENKSSAQFAEEIGVQPSGISHILSGRNKPSLDFVLKMLERYDHLSVDWLLFGKGQMYREEGIRNLFESVENSAEIKDDYTPANDHENADIQPDKTIEVNAGIEKEQVPFRDTGKPVKKIVWFYADNSFEEFYPSGVTER